jgi:hypothetical protein
VVFAPRVTRQQTSAPSAASGLRANGWWVTALRASPTLQRCCRERVSPSGQMTCGSENNAASAQAINPRTINAQSTMVVA